MLYEEILSESNQFEIEGNNKIYHGNFFPHIEYVKHILEIKVKRNYPEFYKKLNTKLRKCIFYKKFQKKLSNSGFGKFDSWSMWLILFFGIFGNSIWSFFIFRIIFNNITIDLSKLSSDIFYNSLIVLITVTIVWAIIVFFTVIFSKSMAQLKDSVRLTDFDIEDYSRELGEDEEHCLEFGQKPKDKNNWKNLFIKNINRKLRKKLNIKIPDLDIFNEIETNCKNIDSHGIWDE